LPSLTYLGPAYSVKLDKAEHRLRGVTEEVSQEWLNLWRVRLNTKHWRIEGDEPSPTVDAGNDGIPDTGWNRKDILAWLTSNGVVLNGYTAKGRALEMVAEHLNPALNEEQVQVEEVLEEEQPQDGDDE
jgi:hypothetical protein|tara:strand:+ start:225 stop:611 length:387 start_codon:yes stop_codon:yes gene_type:complete